MAWTEKATPTPFDTQPISGLLFLDGDLIAHTQEPDLPRDWAKEFEGLKYPVIIFPSGADASVISEEGNIVVCIHRQMRLPYFDTRESAYERALTLAEEHQQVDRVGETGLVLHLDDPDKPIQLTYDNQTGHMLDLAIREHPESAAEHLLQIKEELLDRFRALPPEHQATIGLVVVKELLDGPWGSWFKDALSTRFAVKETVVVPPYMREVSHEDLRRVHLTEEEISQLSDTDMTTIANLIVEHFITDGFWDELAFVTDLVLEGKKRRP